jgi:hypothetical protein
MPNTEALIEKIRALPDERLDEVEDFVDFIVSRSADRALVRAARTASVEAFAKVWDNPEDDIYDAA